MILYCIGCPALDHDARIDDHKSMKRERLLPYPPTYLKVHFLFLPIQQWKREMHSPTRGIQFNCFLTK